MKDILKDLIEHTSALEGVELIKITGSDQETTIAAVTEDKSVILYGKLKNPHSDLIGTFGMPNLGKLNTILSFEEYDDKSKITMTTKNVEGVEIPEAIHFETSTGDFVNDYRLMAKSIVEEKVKPIKFRGTNWNVDFEPSVLSILRLKKQASANSEIDTFTSRTVNGELKFFFGDPSTHSGNFTFESNVSGTLNNNWHWPKKQILAILSLSGDKRMKMSDEGAVEITVDSGLAVYQYLLPAHTK
jgi:hypothetical protein